jgi:tRNA-dihydrouridine synthase B
VNREKVGALSVQLLGTHPDNLAYAAKILSDEGVRFIDLNFGCPSRQVMRKGAGAAMLSRPEVVGDIVARVKNVVPGVVSAKIRGGIEQLDETLGVALAIEAAGADFIVVHPRSSAQGYSGVADWRWVRMVKSELHIPVVGNGDCWYARDVLRMMQWSGCDAVMLGRPALRNPFIFRQVNALHAEQTIRVPTGNDLVRHLHALRDVFERDLNFNEVRVLGVLKEQVKYLLRAIPEPAQSSLSSALLRAQCPKELTEAFAPVSELVGLDIGDDGPRRLESSATVWCDA